MNAILVHSVLKRFFCDIDLLSGPTLTTNLIHGFLYALIRIFIRVGHAVVEIYKKAYNAYNSTSENAFELKNALSWSPLAAGEWLTSRGLSLQAVGQRSTIGHGYMKSVKDVGNSRN
jgi:hypothetical protein